MLILVLGAYLYDHSRRDLIAKGVRIDGVAVGGLHEAAARRKLEHDLVARLDGPVKIRSGSRSWTLAGRQAALRIDLSNMVRQAVDASREGSIVTRTWRSLFGGSVNRDIPLVASYSHQAVRDLTAKIRGDVNRPPRDATVQPGANGLKTIPDQIGQDGREREARRAHRDGPGRAAGKPHDHRPDPQRQAGRHDRAAGGEVPAYIVIDRGNFRLRFYSHLKLEQDL